MLSELAKKWDQKYLSLPNNTPTNPAWVLSHHSQLLPLTGKALDLACGLGGNARFLARCGLSVDAWDISDVALTSLNNFATLNRLPITPTICDIEQMLFPYQQYDVIVITNYLNRGIFQQIQQALKPNGKLFIQTFLAPVQENAPKNKNFYLNSGELSKLFSELIIEIYGEGWLSGVPESISLNRYAWFIGSKKG
jgi:SAM-dependent methyltransferase